ncbi:NIPSNAP family protein [Pseudomonas lopnurensis]|uniref:NIPSNAP family protein n=1 Tax=Pseudomonas lopnurensis TaxID=1477517 RepID=UPI0028AB3BC7|nr:NIPSNAP family protein [Pseudomonas lopnurensis]
MNAFELLQLTLRPGSLGVAQPALRDALAASTAGVTLLGCWYSEIGTLNRLTLLRGFPDDVVRDVERERYLLTPDPFGVDAWLETMEVGDYRLFPFLSLPPPGTYGPFYELREYELIAHGLPSTLDGWRQALGRRTAEAYSPIYGAFYATSGRLPRILHIWPYASLEQRLDVRTRSVAEGAWPPENSTPQLRHMQSTVYLPTTFSPLR